MLLGKYIERRENIVIVGKSGTGKTHLAVALGYAACLQRKRVLFTTASALVSELIDHFTRGGDFAVSTTGLIGSIC